MTCCRRSSVVEFTFRCGRLAQAFHRSIRWSYHHKPWSPTPRKLMTRFWQSFTAQCMTAVGCGHRLIEKRPISCTGET